MESDVVVQVSSLRVLRVSPVYTPSIGKYELPALEIDIGVSTAGVSAYQTVRSMPRGAQLGVGSPGSTVAPAVSTAFVNGSAPTNVAAPKSSLAGEAAPPPLKRIC